MRKPLLILLVLLCVALLMRDSVWELMGGPADPGPADFETLERPAGVPSWLLCPKSLCVTAPPDEEPPVYALPAEALRAALLTALGAEENLSAPVIENGLSERYVQRTAVLHLPDAISIRYIPVSDDVSTLAIYSRSTLPFAAGDRNRERVERWLAKLSALPRTDR